MINARAFETEMVRQRFLDDVRPISSRYWYLWDKSEDGSLTAEEVVEFAELETQYSAANLNFIRELLAIYPGVEKR